VAVSLLVTGTTRNGARSAQPVGIGHRARLITFSGGEAADGVEVVEQIGARARKEGCCAVGFLPGNAVRARDGKSALTELVPGLRTTSAWERVATG